MSENEEATAPAKDQAFASAERGARRNALIGAFVTGVAAAGGGAGFAWLAGFGPLVIAGALVFGVAIGAGIFVNLHQEGLKAIDQDR